MGAFLSDPKKVAAFVGALIGTLLGVPYVMAAIDQPLWELVQAQYPDLAIGVFYVVKAGIYVLSFSLLQASLYLALTSAVTAAAMRFAF